MRLKDRTAVVTGASMGIGAATAVSLARKGVTVWAVARTQERLEVVAGKHPLIRPFVADIGDDYDRERLAQATGPIDILVNNAGLAIIGLVETMSTEEVRHLFEVNVMGLIDLTQRYLPSMLANKRGHICNIGSSVSYLATPPLSVYGATKYAVHGFTDGLRREVINRGVGVSLIQPGPVKTGFWDRATMGDRADVTDESGSGVPADWVAKAILKAIRFERVPGYATIAVPRAVGLGRLADLPVLSYLLDLGSAQRRRVIEPLQIIQGEGGDTEPESSMDDEGDADVIPLHPEKDDDD